MYFLNFPLFVVFSIKFFDYVRLNLRIFVFRDESSKKIEARTYVSPLKRYLILLKRKSENIAGSKMDAAAIQSLENIFRNGNISH